LIDHGRQRTTDADKALRENAVVVDYGQLPAGAWLPDGPTFGASPARPGDLRLGADARQPLVGLVTHAAAERDPTWERLSLAPGTEKDPGALGGWVRPGRTLRTPTFALTTGKLYYLVRGTGHVYAAIDSHALIAGPLHARVVQSVKAGDRLQWITHDL